MQFNDILYFNNECNLSYEESGEQVIMTIFHIAM